MAVNSFGRRTGHLQIAGCCTVVRLPRLLRMARPWPGSRCPSRQGRRGESRPSAPQAQWGTSTASRGRTLAHPPRSAARKSAPCSRRNRRLTERLRAARTRYGPVWCRGRLAPARATSAHCLKARVPAHAPRSDAAPERVRCRAGRGGSQACERASARHQGRHSKPSAVPLRARSALQYLMEPLDHAMWRSFREH